MIAFLIGMSVAHAEEVMLPATGGSGTTIYTILGTALVSLAVVALRAMRRK